MNGKGEETNATHISQLNKNLAPEVISEQPIVCQKTKNKQTTSGILYGRPPLQSIPATGWHGAALHEWQTNRLTSHKSCMVNGPLVVMHFSALR